MVPSLSNDAVPSNEHERPVHVCVNCAVGGTSFGLEFGTRMFFENSEVLPFGFVAVAVIGLPFAVAGSVMVTVPPESAVPDARYVTPEPNEPAGCVAMNTSTTQLAHVPATTLVGVGFDSVGA